MISSFKTALVLAPHTDDGELGCGGTIAKMLEAGVEVHYMAFSICEQSVPEGFAKNQLEIELREAMKSFGISEENCRILGYPVRHFPEHRQSILQDIIVARGEINPDVIFLPCLDDIHQDHGVIAKEGVRAFKRNTIFSYELPWNNFTMTTSAFVALEKKHIEQKVLALSKYETQKGRAYVEQVFLESLARTRGVQIGTKYAEAFELVRLVT